MDQVTLGRTGLRVSAAGLGAGGHSRLGQMNGATEAQSVAIVRAAMDMGVTLIDTAAGYNTEAIVGEAVRGRRDQVVISTKLKINVSQGWGASGPLVDAAELERRVEAGLSRLKTDRIDILHMHGVTADEYANSRAEILPALTRLRAAGKIRFIGVTEVFGSDRDHAMMALALEDGIVDVAMIGLNMVNQSALQRVLPETRRTGMGTMCMFAVRGALADRDAARALVARAIANGEVDDDAVDRDDPFGFVLKESGARTLTEAAYRFCHHAPGIDVVLTGTGSLAHLEENIRAINAGPLPPEVVRKLEAIFGRVSSVSGDRVPA
jgi:L-galactose dehydrogenase